MYLIKDFMLYARLVIHNDAIRKLIFTSEWFQLTMCIIFLLVGGFAAFPLSFIMKTNLLVGMVLLPFVFQVGDQQRINYGYLLLTIGLTIVAFHFNLRIAYFFAISFFALFLVELMIGKVTMLMLPLLAVMSPIFEQVATVIGFPIRLQLSALAGRVLNMSGPKVQVEGNAIIIDGSTFNVDDACMGLNILAFSLLVGIFAAAHQCRVQNSRLSPARTTLYFAGVFTLNLVCNLVRIIILVMFRIEPEHIMHGITGIICFIGYVMIPAYFLSRWTVVRIQRTAPAKRMTIPLPVYLSMLIASFTILLVGLRINVKRQQPTQPEHSKISIEGFRKEEIKAGITKFHNTEALIYIKPIPEFFTSEHTPLLCWQGTGYKFESIREIRVRNHDAYLGRLVKGTKVLYTAWWYSNGETQTIDQFNWRFRMMKGEKSFSLINVTASNEADLKKNISILLNLSN